LDQLCGTSLELQQSLRGGVSLALALLLLLGAVRRAENIKKQCSTQKTSKSRMPTAAVPSARPMPSDADRCVALRCVCVQFVRRSVIATRTRTRTRTLANDDAYMASTLGTIPCPAIPPPSTAAKKSYRRAKCSDTPRLRM